MAGPKTGLKQRSPLSPLQRALYERLKSSLKTPVYDEVQNNAKFPYLVIGDDSFTDWSTKLESGFQVASSIHIWSQAKGWQEVNDLIDSAIKAISDKPLDLKPDGFQLVLHAIDGIQKLRDVDGLTRHGVLRYIFKVQDIQTVQEG